MNRTLRSVALALSGVGLAAGAVFASGATPAFAAGGCGSRGGPGYRLASGKCASWEDAGYAYVPPAPEPAPYVVPVAEPVPYVEPVPEPVPYVVPVPVAVPYVVPVAPADDALWREMGAVLADQQYNRERLGNMLLDFQAGRATGAQFVAEDDYQAVQRQRTLEQATSLAARARQAGVPAVAALADDLAGYLPSSIQFVQDERALLNTGATPADAGWKPLLTRGDAIGARFESVRAAYQAAGR
jgi:hypothetical protein